LKRHQQRGEKTEPKFITFGQRKKQTSNGTTHFPLITLTIFHLFHSLNGALALAGNLGRPYHEDDHGGQNKHNVRVHQIQTFLRFALSVRRSDLVDDECKLTSSIIVVEVVLYNGLWEEEDNNRALLRPLPPSTPKTVVAVDVKSINSKSEGRTKTNKPRFFEEGGRHDCSTKGRFINDMFISGLDEYATSLNDPQWVFLSGAYLHFPPRPPGGACRALLTLLV
jgi:hypothetical protein